jgi:hypothetical protein
VSVSRTACIPIASQTRQASATLLSLARRNTTAANRITCFRHQGLTILALSQMRWTNESHRTAHHRRNPTSFSTTDQRCGMRLLATTRKLCVPLRAALCEQGLSAAMMSPLSAKPPSGSPTETSCFGASSSPPVGSRATEVIGIGEFPEAEPYIGWRGRASRLRHHFYSSRDLQ